MTYCVGLAVDTGLAMLSDSRSNAGVDQINIFRKMATFQHAGQFLDPTISGELPNPNW